MSSSTHCRTESSPALEAAAPAAELLPHLPGPQASPAGGQQPRVPHKAQAAGPPGQDPGFPRHAPSPERVEPRRALLTWRPRDPRDTPPVGVGRDLRARERG